MKIRRKSCAGLILAMVVMIGAILVLWHRGGRKEPTAESSASQTPAITNHGADASDHRSAKDFERRKAALLKDLGDQLRQRETQRIVQVSDAEVEFSISERFREMYHVPPDQLNARNITKYAVVRAPTEVERAEMEDLIGAVLKAPEFSTAGEADEIREELEKNYLVYPKAFKLVTSYYHTYLRDPRNIQVTMLDVDEYTTADAAAGQELKGPDQDKGATAQGPQIKTRYGYLVGVKE